MDNGTAGNLEQVRNALHGITGIEPPKLVDDGPDRYLVMARMNRELDTVDSLRRNELWAYWPSYEQLVPVRKTSGGYQTRRWRRIGIIPGYVFSTVDPSRDFSDLLKRIVGAIDIVRTHSGNPLVISDADVRIIRRIEAGLNTPRPDKIVHAFKLGYKVRFVDDLGGRWPAGVIHKLERDGRIIVEVDGMGRKMSITALPHQIERV